MAAMLFYNEHRGHGPLLRKCQRFLRTYSTSAWSSIT